MNASDIKKKLKEYAQFNSEDDIAKFEELVSEISKLRDPQYINMLVEILDDDTEFPEVMYTIVHALENYPKDIHALGVIKNIPYLLRHSPEWLLSLIYPILNTPNSLNIFRKKMNLIPKESMVQLLDLVAKESEHHRDLCEELKKEL